MPPAVVVGSAFAHVETRARARPRVAARPQSNSDADPADATPAPIARLSPKVRDEGRSPLECGGSPPLSPLKTCGPRTDRLPAAEAAASRRTPKCRDEGRSPLECGGLPPLTPELAPAGGVRDPGLRIMAGAISRVPSADGVEKRASIGGRGLGWSPTSPSSLIEIAAGHRGEGISPIGACPNPSPGPRSAGGPRDFPVDGHEDAPSTSPSLFILIGLWTCRARSRAPEVPVDLPDS